MWATAHKKIETFVSYQCEAANSSPANVSFYLPLVGTPMSELHRWFSFHAKESVFELLHHQPRCITFPLMASIYCLPWTPSKPRRNTHLMKIFSPKSKESSSVSLNPFAPPFTLHGSHLHMLVRNIELKPSPSCKQPNTWCKVRI